MNKIKFQVPVDRIYSKARPRFSKGHTYSPASNRKMEKWIVAAFKEAYPNHQIIETATKLTLLAIFKIPSATKKSLVEGMIGTPCLKTPDADNVLKQMDALNGIAFKDDALVYSVNMEKIWGLTEMLVFTLEW